MSISDDEELALLLPSELNPSDGPARLVGGAGGDSVQFSNRLQGKSDSRCEWLLEYEIYSVVLGF